MLVRHLRSAAVVFCVALAPAVSGQVLDSSSAAHTSSSPQSQWHYLLEPYMMFPNMNGTTGIGNLPETHLDEDPGDIFSHFQIGAMLYGEAYNDNWLLSSDFTYMKLGQDVSGRLIASGHIDLKQL